MNTAILREQITTSCDNSWKIQTRIKYIHHNDQICFLQEKFKFLYEANVSIRTRHVTANQTPWFTTHIQRLIIERNTYARWRKFKTPELRTLFQNCHIVVVKSIEHAKKIYYQRSFSSTIDSSSKWKEIRKIGIGKGNVSSCDVDVNRSTLVVQWVVCQTISLRVVGSIPTKDSGL